MTPKTKSVATKISPNSYKFKTKTAISAAPKYVFTPNPWEQRSLHISLRSENENVDTKICPISYKFKTKTSISESPKKIFTPNHWAHESIWYEFWE